MQTAKQEGFGDRQAGNYIPMESANPVPRDDAPLPGIDIIESAPDGDAALSAQEAAQWVAEQRWKRDAEGPEPQPEPESAKPNEIVRQYFEQDTGKPKPATETVSLEQAAHDLTTARNREETTADLESRDEIARVVDELRAGTTTESLGVETTQPSQIDQQAQPQPLQQQQLSQDQQLAKTLSENPHLLAAVQQVHDRYTQVTAHNAHAALVNLVASFPELSNVAPQHLQVAIQAIGSQNPQRAQAIMSHIDQVTALMKQSAEAAQVQQSRWAAQAHAQFQSAAAQHDEAYSRYADAETSSKAERAAIEREAKAMLLEGGTEQQIMAEWNTNWAFRSATAQKVLFEAARTRLARKGLKQKLARPVPHVQRPGSPLERASDEDHRLRQLNKGGGVLSVKEAANLVTARRQAAARGRR